MNSWLAEGNLHRGISCRASLRAGLVGLMSLMAGAGAMAQTRTFTASPLAPSGTISAAKTGVQSNAGAAGRLAYGNESSGNLLRAALPSGICDVTLAPGSAPAGYLPLSAFGIPPVAGVTDDSVTDFFVPSFTFAGETYNMLGFSSNGYAIVGGSTGPGDNSFINQDLPDPASPNNVLAAFWTDLNPAAAGELRIATLTDGANTWIVMDWANVTEFSTTNSNSFEIWIGVNNDANPAEDVSFAYGTITGSGDGGFLTAGAENRLGTRGQNSYLNGTGTLPATGAALRVTTTSCAPVACDVTLAPGSTPGGYLPLSVFGIPPVAGVTDDSVTDFTVPSFTFAGETYNSVGFSSNGYVIVGGSTGPGDNTFVNQNLPDPASPNNLFAPFWTDLNPAAAGELRIGSLTDGADTWVVLDWANVREFSTANSNSFEVWIGVDGDAHPVEDVSFAYGPIGGSGDGGFLTVGAENRLGTRGQNYRFNATGTLPVAGTGLRIATTSCRLIFSNGFEARSSLDWSATVP